MSWSWIVNHILEPSSSLVAPVLLCVAALAFFRFGKFLQKLTQRMDHQEEKASEVIKEFKESIKHLLQKSDRQEEKSKDSISKEWIAKRKKHQKLPRKLKAHHATSVYCPLNLKAEHVTSV